VHHHGLRAPAWASRLAGPDACSAVRTAAADQPGERPGWRLPRSDRRPPQPLGRLGYRAGFQATGVAGPACRSAHRPERLDLPAKSTRSSHRVRLAAAAASWASRVAAGQAEQSGLPRARRPSCQTRGATTWIAWLLEAAADPIPARHQLPAGQGESLDWTQMEEYAAALGPKRSQPGRRPAFAVGADPLASAPGSAESFAMTPA
jgi:hypothetical protein